MTEITGYSALTPDRLLDGVEETIGRRLVGFAHPLISYINRVYELQEATGERIIAKFYRPGRWSLAALEEEHAFVLACAEAEIPVVPPMILPDGGTLGDVDGIYFAVYPKRRGRDFEACTEEEWQRIGHVIGRLHAVGRQEPAEHRVTLHPSYSTEQNIRDLLEGDYVPASFRTDFGSVAREIADAVTPMFEDVELFRIHGDCHHANILERPDEGLMLIDFDDMATGPAVQDLWMLLPDRADRCRWEINLILEGYEAFQEFDDRTLRLIEPLRAMRMLYFLAWCARQIADVGFSRTFPDWGSDAFWRAQIADLIHELALIRELG